MITVNFRRMGDTGIECSVLGLGTGRLASAGGGLSRANAEKLIGVAEGCGINLIDTADSYAQGECEKIIGSALQGKRGRFIIITKAGYTFAALGGGLRLIKPLVKRALKYFQSGKNLASSIRSNVSRQNFAPEAIHNSINASLRRFRSDYIDIFLLHSPPAGVLLDETLFDLLRRVKQAGKIRHFGVSTPEREVLELALRVPALSVVQTPVNPTQPANRNVLPELHKAKMGVVANQIFLSGKLLDSDAQNGTNDLQKLKNSLTSLAAAHRVSLNRLLIEFALSQPGVATILTGTTNPTHLKQNVADVVTPGVLSAEELSQLMELDALDPKS